MDPNNTTNQIESTTAMDSQQQNPILNTFMEITSSTLEEAQFFLEGHNFDLDSAVSTFFESTPTHTDTAIPTAPIIAPSRYPFSSPSLSPSRSRSHSPPASGRTEYNLRSRTTRGGPGIVRTLADLNRAGPGSDEDDDDSNLPSQYFTGGHKSGMVVQDPSKDGNVDAIFEQARRVGAVEGPADVYHPSSSSSFAGTARLLSGEMVSSSPHEPPPAVVVHSITFWRNGFTVGDGPLRMVDDEANAAFLESIKNSECPKELEPKDRRTKVHVNLTRRDENFHEPKKQQIAFRGVGRTLGTSNSIPSESSAILTTNVLNTAPSPVMGIVVDGELPSTSIQLRLADGARVVSRFNYRHTIRDIHAFIDASRSTRVGGYTLQLMGFPPKPLTELDQTIELAGLANSVVIQKF